jgi:hypothetical protein
MEALTADTESDEYSEQGDEDSETLQRQGLQLQQIEEEYNGGREWGEHERKVKEE